MNAKHLLVGLSLGLVGLVLNYFFLRYLGDIFDRYTNAGASVFVVPIILYFLVVIAYLFVAGECFTSFVKQGWLGIVIGIFLTYAPIFALLLLPWD